jgi:hypothetical protein
MPHFEPPVKTLAPDHIIMCARIKERSRQPTKALAIAKIAFFGFSPSAKPTCFLQDFLKIKPYQRAPSNHWMTAEIRTTT